MCGYGYQHGWVIYWATQYFQAKYTLNKCAVISFQMFLRTLTFRLVYAAMLMVVTLDARVCCTGQNLALRHTATQISTFQVSTASLAVDGNTDSDWAHGSCIHTQLETSPWWMVDLGQITRVIGVNITNRGDSAAVGASKTPPRCFERTIYIMSIHVGALNKTALAQKVIFSGGSSVAIWWLLIPSSMSAGRHYAIKSE